MTERYSQDLKMMLDLELQRNERVKVLAAAYEELAEDEKALSRLAAGIGQDAGVRIRGPERQSASEPSAQTDPQRLQPIVRDQMKTLLEDHAPVLTETDIQNLLNQDYTQNTLDLQLGGFPLLRRREAGRGGSDNDRHNRFYTKLYGGRFYLCSQWRQDHHLDNAGNLLRVVDQLAGQEPNHAGIPELERHRKALGDYIDRSAWSETDGTEIGSSQGR